jgi:hypothetical protein
MISDSLRQKARTRKQRHPASRHQQHVSEFIQSREPENEKHCTTEY